MIFFFDGKSIGFVRVLSNGGYQVAIYDIAIVPEYQGKGLGWLIIENLLSGFPRFNYILSASLREEDFYSKMNSE